MGEQKQGQEGETMRSHYEVGISKYYFPRDKWPKDVTEFYETVIIDANTRFEAALRAWRYHGKRWLAEMGPKQTSVRRISLHVDTIKEANKGCLGRLEPIHIHTQE